MQQVTALQTMEEQSMLYDTYNTKVKKKRNANLSIRLVSCQQNKSFCTCLPVPSHYLIKLFFNI